MSKIFLTIATIFSLTQFVALSCEASCAIGNHVESEKDSVEHLCCQSHKKSRGPCDDKKGNSDGHDCLHMLMNSSSVISTPFTVDIFPKKLNFDVLHTHFLPRSSNSLFSKTVECDDQRRFQRFRSLCSIYIFQKKILI